MFLLVHGGTHLLTPDERAAKNPDGVPCRSVDRAPRPGVLLWWRGASVFYLTPLSATTRKTTNDATVLLAAGGV